MKYRSGCQDCTWIGDAFDRREDADADGESHTNASTWVNTPLNRHRTGTRALSDDASRLLEPRSTITEHVERIFPSSALTLQEVMQQRDALLDRLKLTAALLHEQHSTFWPLFDQCHVEICIKNRNAIQVNAALAAAPGKEEGNG